MVPEKFKADINTDVGTVEIDTTEDDEQESNGLSDLANMSPEELANAASSAAGRADIAAECGIEYEEGTFTDEEI